ncbi:acyl-CoA thioesterase [Lysinibacillus fusiformis]
MSEKQIEIRYAETDQMGVIYHANYIIWMEKNKTLIYEGGEGSQ